MTTDSERSEPPKGRHQQHDALPEIMTKLQQQMGREPAASISNIEDYAPKKPPPSGQAMVKCQHISDGLREAVEQLFQLHHVLLGSSEPIDVPEEIAPALLNKLDVQAAYVEKLHRIIADMQAVIL